MSSKGHAFLGIMSGGEPGLYAGSKSVKVTPAKSKSNVLPDDAETSTSTGDGDFSKLTMRSGGGGVDLGLVANTSDNARLIEMLRQLLSKQNGEKPAELTGPNVHDLPVQATADHPLDSAEAAYNPRYSMPIMPRPMTHQVPTQFKHDRHIWLRDAYQLGPGETLALNKNTPWHQLCFPDTTGDKLVEPGNYHAPFPGQSGDPNNPDLHMRSQKTCTLVVNFALPLSFPDAEGKLKYKGPMTHRQFISEFEKSGSVVLSIPQSHLKAAVAEYCQDIDWDATPYHILPFDIAVTELQTNFKVPFDMVVCTPSAHATLVDGKSKHLRQSWSVARGTDPTARNLVGDKKGPHSSNYYNKILADGASNFSRNEIDRRDPVYIAPGVNNNPDFGRYINRNWPCIWRELAACVKPLERNEQSNAFRINLPHKSNEKDFTFIQWFVLGHMKEIFRRTREAREKPNWRAGSHELEFNKIYYSNEGPDAQAYTFISREVLTGILREYQEKYNQEKQLMRLSALEVLLWPVQGRDGWKAYKQLAEEDALVSPAKATEKVYVNIELTITYEPYKHALITAGQLDTCATPSRAGKASAGSVDEEFNFSTPATASS